MSWREEFLKDYFNDKDESLWDEALNLKNSKIPPKLYKFTKDAGGSGKYFEWSPCSES